jgi:hypothetical protein
VDHFFSVAVDHFYSVANNCSPALIASTVLLIVERCPSDA